MQRAKRGLTKLPCWLVHDNQLALLGACGESLLARGQQLEAESLQAVRLRQTALFHPSSPHSPAHFTFQAQQESFSFNAQPAKGTQ